MKLDILNTRAVKQILKLIKKQWDVDFKEPFAFLKDQKDKVYIINKDFAEIDPKKLNINSLGLYFGQIKNSQFRLSVEGSQLIGPKAKKNVLELDEIQFKEWIQGNDLEIKTPLEETFLIIKHKTDFLGAGKYSENKLFNYIPKERRVTL